MTPNYQRTIRGLLGTLEPRQREVLERRFGLKKKQRETLEAIGKDHDLTRERVRQIENHCLSKVRAEIGNFSNVFNYLEKNLAKWGGLRREDKLIEELTGPKFANQILFLLTLAEPFERKKEDNDFYTLWHIDKSSLSLAQKTINQIEKFLAKESQVFSFEGLLKTAQNIAQDLPKNAFSSFLEATKKIEEGPTSQFGLSHWPEIRPRGVRDRAYLALKKAETPLHFRDLTQLINESFPKEKTGSQRKALAQTVHNELIKDPRFILVGRGLYALKDWGFEPGTVKEIIFKVLKERKRPLVKEEILKEVSKQRLVKENTILLNLSDKSYFKKDAEGRYRLNKS